MKAQHCYVIAEAGVNHDGSAEDARRLIDAAADAGADCVKFQTFQADALASKSAQKAAYQLQTTDAAESQHEMLRKLELPRAAYPSLLAHAKARKIDFLSTPFDEGSFSFLFDDLGLTTIKIGSGDMTNSPLLLEVSKRGAEIILSTGMATLAEVEQALSVIAFGYSGRTDPPSRKAFNDAWRTKSVHSLITEKVVLLHCVTEYPASPWSTNLRAMDTMASAFGIRVGYSDHTLGTAVAMAAVARGAVVIEKHLTLDRTRKGPDHMASLEPDDFRRMVEGIREVEGALGNGRKIPQLEEQANIPIARKSLVAASEIKKGDVLTSDHIATKRPATGRDPIEYWEMLGKRAERDYSAEEPL
jgi:N-acetylneuraminate synthase